jgi:hypothetical protein
MASRAISGPSVDLWMGGWPGREGAAPGNGRTRPTRSTTSHTCNALKQPTLSRHRSTMPRSLRLSHQREVDTRRSSGSHELTPARESRPPSTPRTSRPGSRCPIFTWQSRLRPRPRSYQRAPASEQRIFVGHFGRSGLRGKVEGSGSSKPLDKGSILDQAEGCRFALQREHRGHDRTSTSTTTTRVVQPSLTGSLTQLFAVDQLDKNSIGNQPRTSWRLEEGQQYDVDVSGCAEHETHGSIRWCNKERRWDEGRSRHGEEEGAPSGCWLLALGYSMACIGLAM